MSRFLTLCLFVAAALASSSACAVKSRPGGPVPQPFPQPSAGAAPTDVPAPPRAGSAFDGYAIAGTALAHRGTPYRNGGSDPSGFDCSGFVWFVFAQHGFAVPRTVADQAQLGERVSTSALDPGDLVFFNTKGVGATHVGIAIGGDEFVHAPSSKGEVRVERLGSSYWSARLVDARRITPRGAGPCASAGAHSCQ
jgi:cell wall-associated NlpC family hydrolase